jgi:hypothetical protein
MNRFSQSIATLEVAAENCKRNAPIHAREGNKEQAKCSRENAKDYRAAIKALKTLAGSLVAMALLMLSGCAALNGGRDYSASIEKKADGSTKCSFNISSTSNLAGAGFKACNGAFEASASSVGQGSSAADFNKLINDAALLGAGKLPEAKPVAPPAETAPAK